MSVILQGLAAVTNRDAKVLILGSMPGAQSLASQQYYAHPRNAFWPIMASLCGFSANLPYHERLVLLRQHGFALWDVLAHCQRQGSLDSAIRHEQANDFNHFLAEHGQLKLIAFNGAKAQQSFNKQVLPTLAITPPRLLTLPSTSPAHAAMSFDAKLQQWLQIKQRYQLNEGST
ncbi:DNA-deoxyinosine glycosylase [Rheinheimera sp. UJ51]|uniref:DNA-deoxyinosine glycosylase n=1 Tax=Rheinheimera sp. UJ51 TaxID=2892446 RepID=UPI001E5D24C8|nr:DNA-deoxyinosine glycosylase [Rheinheimera sp. UJ51]MCC5452275.1 DNA-deoxyinosine glycosylase [Rheinheimera sp. UJ51]